MPGLLTRAAYRRTVEEDVAWLRSQPRSLERDHIELVLWDSIEALYERPRLERCRAERLWCERRRRQAVIESEGGPGSDGAEPQPPTEIGGSHGQRREG